MFAGRDSLCRPIANDSCSMFLDGVADSVCNYDYTLGLLLELKPDSDSDSEKTAKDTQADLSTIAGSDNPKWSSTSSEVVGNKQGHVRDFSSPKDRVACTLLDDEASQNSSCGPQPPKLRRMCKHIDSIDLLKAGC